MKVKNLAKDKIVTLKALKLEFEKFWTNVTVLKKLCVGKSKLKRQAKDQKLPHYEKLTEVQN